MHFFMPSISVRQLADVFMEAENIPKIYLTIQLAGQQWWLSAQMSTTLPRWRHCLPQSYIPGGNETDVANEDACKSKSQVMISG